MSTAELAISMLIVAAATASTRWLPFFIFTSARTPEIVRYLGRCLPHAAIGLLVVYAFKDVSFLSGTHGAPELIASALTVAVHVMLRRPLLSMAAGTACFMILVQTIYA